MLLNPTRKLSDCKATMMILLDIKRPDLVSKFFTMAVR